MTTAPMIHRRDLRKALGISGETLRVWLQRGKIPPPDTNLSRESQWWRAETLAAAGINVAPAAASQPTPAASQSAPANT